MKFCVDVSKVCEFLGIDSEQFNSLTVSQLEEAKWGIQEAEIEARRNDEKIMEKYRYFFKEYDLFVSLFGKDVTDKYLPVVPLEEIVTTEHVRQGLRIHGKPSQLIGHGDWYFPIRRGRGSRSGAKEYAPADIYEVSSDYQGLKHSTIIFAIFEEQYAWTNDYNISIYEIGSGHGLPQFYLETELEVNGHSSLYVPFNAFMERDIEGILKANKDYLTSYYRYGDKGEIVYERLTTSKVVKNFFEFLK
jgi:hypothetical protein